MPHLLRVDKNGVLGVAERHVDAHVFLEVGHQEDVLAGDYVGAEALLQSCGLELADALDKVSVPHLHALHFKRILADVDIFGHVQLELVTDNLHICRLGD